VREVERNLGITHGVLKGWMKKHQEQQDAALSGRNSSLSPEVELRGEANTALSPSPAAIFWSNGRKFMLSGKR